MALIILDEGKSIGKSVSSLHFMALVSQLLDQRAFRIFRPTVRHIAHLLNLDFPEILENVVFLIWAQELVKFGLSASDGSVAQLFFKSR